MTKIRPLGDRVLVEPIELKEVNKGGIIIPDNAKEKPMEGKVIAVGKKRDDDGKEMFSFPEGIPVIQVWNKIDISGHRPSVDNMFGITQVYLSTQTGQGIDFFQFDIRQQMN